MSESSFLRRRWKLVVNVITVGLLVVLIFTLRHQMGQTIANLTQVHAWALALIVPVEALNYHAQTRLYQRLFGTIDIKLDYKMLLKMSLELNFINHVFPSAGVSGISYFCVRMKNGSGVPTAKTSLVQVMKILLLFFSFEPLLLAGLVFLAIGGKANNLTMLVTGALSMLVVLVTIGFMYVAGSKKRINSFLDALASGLNKFIHTVRPSHSKTIKVEKARFLLEEMHEDYKVFRANPSGLKAPLWYCIMANVTEILAIYVVYVAFGKWVNVGAIILAYAVANFAGVLSVLPGGIGMYEALMTAVLVASGIPAALSLPVTIMYRVVNTVLQVPPGYVLYHRSVMARKDENKIAALDGSGSNTDG